MEQLKHFVTRFRKDHPDHEGNPLGRKITRAILEAWRRYHVYKFRFHDGKKLEDCWLGVGYEEVYLKHGLFRPLCDHKNGMKRWGLTEKGVEWFKDFDSGIRWNFKYNDIIFNNDVFK